MMWLLCIGVALATIGVDVSQPTSVESFKCLKGIGYDFAIVRGYQSNDQVDSSAPETIRNAWAGGMAHVDTADMKYFFPDVRAGDCGGQMRRGIEYLHQNNAKFGTVWWKGRMANLGLVDIESDSGNFWNAGVAANEACLEAMVNTAQSMSVTVGIYASASQWEEIFGSREAFTKYGNVLPLWFADYSGTKTFDDFEQFGGWTRPAMKQYAGDLSACNAGIDANWYP